MGSRARPTSASSRTAWGDYGSARPDSQFDFGQDGIRDDPDLSPNGMDNDSVYNGTGAKPKSSTTVATTGSNKSTSFFGKIGRGIRSLWATRQTEDVKGDRELHVKTTLRELIVYIVFLVILCIITFGMTSTTMYYYTKVMSDLFLDTTWSGGGSFRTITSVEDFWKFAKGPLLKGLYWETWYNNVSVPDDQLGYIYYENKLLGVPRLRQLQVHSNSCVVHEDFKNVIRECYESYAESLENKEAFGEKDNNTAWYYRSENELDGSSHWGIITTYSGAGYVQDLYTNKSQSETMINYLFDKRWIQRGTRIVFIDFTVYNANINLFCVVRLTVEFPPTGGAISHATMRTVKLIRYVTVMDYFIMACEFIFCLFIIYYMVEEAIEIKKHKFAYFKNFWNILDIVVIVIALVCVAFNIYRLIKVNDLLSDLLNKPNEYADFVFLGYGQTQFDNAIAIAVFFAWIKIFKYISFNKTMTQLSSTLGKCAKDLAGFAVMFFIIFLAFTQLGYLLFGTQVKDFSNFQNSFFTLFRIILGDFDFDQLEAANRVLGPIFFMLFVFFVFFVLINMFLAIINDTYSEVKGDMANQKNEFEMTDYFKRGYEKMISKLNFKHDKIVDIQKALHSADMNNDKQVDFDEWRQDLKTRGYADGEIEALFAKYDVDGDRVLDEEEQKRMQADLNDQKAALNKEYDELEKMNRPESAHRSTSRVSINDGSGSDSDDDDSRTKSSRSGPSQSVSYEEFTVLSRRVDRMEHSIGSIVSKIDAVLVKLELMEKAKLKRRETMGKILDSITESDGTSDEVKREQMERLVREELERWDSESSITPQTSGRGASPGSGGRGGARPRSRPGSGGHSDTDDGEEEIDLPEFDGKSDDDSDESSDFTLRVESTNVSKHGVSGVGGAALTSVSGSHRPDSDHSTSKQFNVRETSPNVRGEICTGHLSSDRDLSKETAEHVIDVQARFEDTDTHYYVTDTKFDQSCPSSDKNASEQSRSKTSTVENHEQVNLVPLVNEVTKQLDTNLESKNFVETQSMGKPGESEQTQSVVQQTEITISEEFEVKHPLNIPNTVSNRQSESECESHAKSNYKGKQGSIDTEISPPIIEIDRQLKHSNICQSEASSINDNPFSHPDFPEQPLNPVPDLSLKYHLHDRPDYPYSLGTKSNFDLGQTFPSQALIPKNSQKCDQQKASALESMSNLSQDQTHFPLSHCKSNGLSSQPMLDTSKSSLHPPESDVTVDSEQLSTIKRSFSPSDCNTGALSLPYSVSDVGDPSWPSKLEINQIHSQDSESIPMSERIPKEHKVLLQESEKSSQFMSELYGCKMKGSKLEIESFYHNDLKPSAAVDKNASSMPGERRSILPNSITLPTIFSKSPDNQGYTWEQPKPQNAIEFDTDVEAKLAALYESSSVRQMATLFETKCGKDLSSHAHVKLKMKNRDSPSHTLQKQSNNSCISSQIRSENMDDVEHTKTSISLKKSGDNYHDVNQAVIELKEVKQLQPVSTREKKDIKILVHDGEKTDVHQSESITDIQRKMMSSTAINGKLSDPSSSVDEIVTDNLQECQSKSNSVSNDNSNKMKHAKRSKERKKATDKAGLKEKGKSSVTTPRGQKVSLGTLAKGSANLNDVGAEKSRPDHVYSDRIDVDYDKNNPKTNNINPFEMYVKDKVSLPQINIKHTNTRSQNKSKHGKHTQELVTSKKTMAPKREMMPLPVIPVGGLSLEPGTDDMHKAPGGDMFVSNRNQVSTHSSCKTPVMEKVSTTVFV